MTKEEIIKGHYTCTCNEGYSSRNMIDPSCVLHEQGGEIELIMDEWSRQKGDEWIKTTDKLPENPGKFFNDQIPCLVYYKKQIRVLVWNCHYLVWDDESGDDYICAPYDPTHWMPLPEPPKNK